MAEMGLGAERPLNKEKNMDRKVKEKRCVGSYPGNTNKGFGILSVNRWLAQGTGRKRTEEEDDKRNTNAGQLGLSMAKANKILRDIDREFGFKLNCSDIIGHWAMMQSLLEE